jgi:hypothetical protein
MTVLDMFKRCVNIGSGYNHTEINKGSYFVEYDNNTLYIYFQGSNGDIDWKNNFDFGAEPYKDMPAKWKAHKGFVRVWKEIVPFIKDDIMNPDVKRINIVGYSHGAALSVLAHEYAWFNRPDIRDNIFGYGFEPPRVFRGRKIPDELIPRWENFTVFRNGADIVTHVPPLLFGYKHVGKLVHLNKDREILVDKHFKFKCVNEHYYPNVVASLEAEGFGN